MGTLYEILGVSQEVSFAVLKKKYQSLALLHHPDKYPLLSDVSNVSNDESDQDGQDQTKDQESRKDFAIISHAYSILSDPITRSHYDQQLHQVKEGPILDEIDLDQMDHDPGNLYMIVTV